MDVVQSIAQVLALIAAVETAKHVSPKVQGYVTIAVALVLGALAGYLQLGGLTSISAGLALGLKAVGGNMLIDAIGNKTN